MARRNIGASIWAGGLPARRIGDSGIFSVQDSSLRRRIVLVVVVALAMIVPTVNASANGDCAPIKGTAMLDFGNGGGFANLSYDGERMRIPFETTDLVPTPDGFDVYFVWHFPGGDVDLVEHSVATSKGGPVIEFNSTIDVLGGGSGTSTWRGTANASSMKGAIVGISGELCMDV